MTRKAAVLAAPVPRMGGAGPNLTRLSAASGLHSSLTVGPANDEFEQEAERSADYVMNMPGLGGAALPVPPPRAGGSGSVQRTCACGGRGEGEGECEECARARLQRKASDGASVAAPASVYEVLRSPGHPLDAVTRAFMEPRFEHDFGRVRIHTDGAAAAAAREVHALAYTTGTHVVFGAGQYQPGTDAGRRLLAHELTHVIQQSGGQARRAQPAVMRAGACEHDKKGTGCGPGGGVIRFPSEKMHLDQEVVTKGLKQFGGHWLTEVQCPPNPEKSEDTKQTGGRIDGLRYSESGGLKVEVVEVKPRSPGSLQSTKITGGCAQASREAHGYVAELKRIAPRVKALSEKFAKIGGYRLMDHHKPKGKVEGDIFKNVGVNIDDDDWFNAWRFYNSLQNKIPKVFTKAFDTVDVSVFTGGTANSSYDAIGWKYHCDKKEGVEKLVYMVNNDGAASYGCERSCGDEKKEEPKEKPKEKKPEEKKTVDPADLAARLKDIADKKEMLARELALEASGLEAQRQLINKPSAIGFVGFWVNELYNTQPPDQTIWAEVDGLLIRVDNALKRKNVQEATAALMRARRAYTIAVKKFNGWEAGLPGAAAKMERAIKVVAVAAVLAFVAPTVLSKLNPATASEAAQTLMRIEEVMVKADRAIRIAEAAGEEIELAMQAEEEVEQLLAAGRLVTWF